MRVSFRPIFWRLLILIPLLISACGQQKPQTTSLPTADLDEPVKTPAQEQPTSPEVLPGETTPIEPTTSVAIDFPVSELPVFASFSLPEVDRTVVPPALEAEADLSNVRISFALSNEQLERLGDVGFVVSPGDYKEFFTLYEAARYDNQPIFVTSDSLLHVYHLLFDKVLRTAETEYFIDLLGGLNQATLAQLDAQYQELKGSAWQDAALRSVAFVGVASRLLDPEAQIPAYAGDLVQAEIANIEAADGMKNSPIFPGLEFGEDYTQYIPRGHYTRSEALKNYFKSMMWYGRMTFRLEGGDPETGKAETRSALLLVQALRNSQVNGRPAMDVWMDLYGPTSFFVGRSDDLTAIQYQDVIDAVYGENPSLASVSDESKLEQFIELAKQLPPPRILGLVIMDTDDETKSTKGLRFMGQRFVPDAYVFRQLMYRNVGTRDNRRGLPMGLDLLAAMGSERAYQLLERAGQAEYENYTSQMEKMRQWLGGLKVEEWTETLYNTWLYTFFPLLEVPRENYPAFMQSAAWLDKQLNTSLGSWTELKHDTILYAKQAYAELGGGPPPPPPLPPKGYVEPVPEFYARLKALTELTRSGLESRGLLAESDADNLARLADLAGALQQMAEKQLRGEALTDEEYERIRYYGGELEHLTMAAADTEDTEDPNAPKFLDEEPQAAVIADVATDPGAEGGPKVLEEGVGRINPIYVVVPIVDADGSTYLQVAKGGVFSQYEFAWPASDRLTNEKWRQMLDEGQAPPLAEWMGSFFTQQGEAAELTRAILNYENAVTYAYWELGYGNLTSDPLLQDFVPELIALAAQRQYIGHQLVYLQVRSVDLQADTLAVVTAQETWKDQLFQFEGDYAEYTEESLKERGPYTLDVTYTLEYLDGYWQVTNAVYANQPPDW